jgi:hypothetical protein
MKHSKFRIGVYREYICILLTEMYMAHNSKLLRSLTVWYEAGGGGGWSYIYFHSYTAA